MKLFSKLRSIEGCQSLKVEVRLALGSGWVEGQYCVEGPHCDEAEVSGCVKEERSVTA